MSQQKADTSPALSIQDILLILFKHKGKILFFSTLGVAAAAAVYFLRVPLYESQAKLMLRYVIDRSAIDPDMAEAGKIGDPINSEVQIFTSWDLVSQAAEAIGADRLLPSTKGPVTAVMAATSISGGLSAAPASKGSNVIVLTYRNRDPELANLVLTELITRYFVKHLEVHRSAEAFNFVAQQSDQVRARLNQTEEELRQLKAKAGIITLRESTVLINSELASTQDALQAAEAEYSEQKARVTAMEASAAEFAKDPAPPPPPIENAALQQHQALVGELRKLRQAQIELLRKYGEMTEQPQLPSEVQRARQIREQDRANYSGTRTNARQFPTPMRESRPGFLGIERDTALALARERYRRQNDTGFGYQSGKKNFDTLVKEAENETLAKRTINSPEEKASQLELVRINEMQIDNLEKQRIDLERKFPELAGPLPTAVVAAATGQLNLANERARLAGIEARLETMKSHLQQIQTRAAILSELGPQIERLERKKEIEETNYKYFHASLEKARVDEALDPSKIPNISVVQKPSPALRVTSDLKKTVLGFAGGGVAFGLALAFLIELVLNRSVKRPSEIERLLGTPILLSVPYLNGRHPLRLRWPRPSRASLTYDAAPWNSDHFMRPYAEALRDRLVLFFEVHQMNHKPKLVAVTSCSERSGTSTLAGGIAAALSETGDGKVLLVDMNVGRPEMHPFFRGVPACSLTEALVGEPAQAGENLYLATANSPDGKQAQLVPRRFYDLMPHLKASDFDYIIFDMPPFTQTSIALPMSRFMDKVILIAEAEKSSREILKRASREFASVNANVSVILNKARSYTPKWITAET
jgi:uncharacterized protein involved in exopolysaccharide biosynthesis/Mrp family chromosome partitioning ATPase